MAAIRFAYGAREDQEIETEILRCFSQLRAVYLRSKQRSSIPKNTLIAITAYCSKNHVSPVDYLRCCFAYVSPSLFPSQLACKQVTDSVDIMRTRYGDMAAESAATFTYERGLIATLIDRGFTIQEAPAHAAVSPLTRLVYFIRFQSPLSIDTRLAAGSLLTIDKRLVRVYSAGSPELESKLVGYAVNPFDLSWTRRGKDDYTE